MTFDEAVIRIKNQHLPDESSERLGDDRIMGAVQIASTEVASAFSLGRTLLTATLNDPSGGELLLSVEQGAGVYDLEEVTVGGLLVRRTNPDQAQLYRHVSGPPRYYSWERTIPRTLTFYPAPAVPKEVRLTVLRDFALTGSIWGGAYAPWHDLVTFKATEKLLTMQNLFEEAGQYQGRYQAREQEFSAHLQGLTKDVAMAMAARA